ncbi:MAG: hypothetical protein R3B99_23855 [Polyangiales bacterium]
MQEQVAAHASKSPLGPVSKVLLQELREVTRRRGVVLWLDGANHRRLRGGLTGRPRGGFVVRAFRGSYLELMLALDGVAGGTAKVPLLVYRARRRGGEADAVDSASGTRFGRCRR